MSETTANSPEQDGASLAALRQEIDTADQEMHRLLMHRSQVIEQLIEAKKLGPRGAAFRPDREASMMRRFAERHSGRLPLSTVEHIWREIIGTFTQLQAPYRVLSARADDPRMRDLLRYYFGFSSPLEVTATNRDAVATVARTGTDLAVVALDDPLEENPDENWWRALEVPANAGDDGVGAKVIAALPFLPLTGGLDLPPALVIGPQNVDAPTDFHVYAVILGADAPTEGLGRVLSRETGIAVIASPLAPEAFEGAAPEEAEPEWLGSFAEPPVWND